MGSIPTLPTSNDLLSDAGIALDEVIILEPTAEATVIRSAEEITDVRALVEGGLQLGEAVLPHATPPGIDSLATV